MYNRIKQLTNEELTRLHDASMSILQEVGVAFHLPEALEIFKQHGVKVDGQTVYIPEEQVRKALESAPSHFSLEARNPEKSVIIGGDHLVVLPGYGPAFMVTADGDQRQPLMADYDNLCKLVHTSPHIDMCGIIMIEPSDVSPETSHLDMMASNLLLCDKPFLGSAASRRAARESIEMAEIVWGGRDSLKNRPVMVPIISSLSPLQYSDEMAGALMEYALHGQPVLLGLLMMAGGTGPVTLAGTLAVQNAELLAGVVLAQLTTPGVPLIYGSTSSITDMRTGALSIGAPELSMLQSATLQMARFYDLPSRGSGGLTDAHFPDMQAGMESTLALSTTINSGANFVLHGCGIMGAYIGMSYEKFLADEEMVGMLKRVIGPMDISAESIDLETIKEVGVGGEYLTHQRTFERCRSEFFMPTLMNRGDHESWTMGGRKRLDQAATEMLAQRLAQYERPAMDPALEKELSRYVARKKAA